MFQLYDWDYFEVQTNECSGAAILCSIVATHASANYQISGICDFLLARNAGVWSTALLLV
jgi:hypothetical protein